LSAAAYPIYLQLTSNAGGHSFHPQPEDAPCCSDKGTHLTWVCAQTEDKIDDAKDSFYEELERIFDKFPKYHMKILLGDFNGKVGRDDTFKPTIGSESLHKISNDN
jgi:hypothetical protein